MAHVCALAMDPKDIELLGPELNGTVETGRGVASAWNFSLINSPAGHACRGGDWSDAVAISDDAFALTIGDVTGHGEPAFGTMEIVRASMLRDPSEILAAANSVAYSIRGGVVVTAIVAIVNRRLRTLTFANAGHPAPLMMTPILHGFLTHVKADLPLGISPTYSATNYVVTLPDDSLFVLYTDGITEHNRDSVRGEGELVAACRAAYDWPAPDLAASIARRVFYSGRGRDDAAVTALREFGRSA
jgi:serine phosphatase RsbU (regulator of sigma subunit)